MMHIAVRKRAYFLLKESNIHSKPPYKIFYLFIYSFLLKQATNRQFPQTVTGAYLSGLREAKRILRS